MAKTLISTRYPQELLDRVNRHAKRTGQTRTALLVAAVERLLDQLEKKEPAQKPEPAL